MRTGGGRNGKRVDMVMLVVVGKAFIVYDVRQGKRRLVKVVVHCGRAQEPKLQNSTRRNVATNRSVEFVGDIVSRATEH